MTAALSRTGKNRTTVANAVRLLHLDRGILELIEDDRLSAGHGRALLPDGLLSAKAAAYLRGLSLSRGQGRSIKHCAIAAL